MTKLALEWDERLSFTLADDLSLKRLRVGEALLEELDGDDLDPAQRLDAEFVILALQVRQLIARLDEVFGLAPSSRPAVPQNSASRQDAPF